MKDIHWDCSAPIIYLLLSEYLKYPPWV